MKTKEELLERKYELALQGLMIVHQVAGRASVASKVAWKALEEIAELEDEEIALGYYIE